MARPMPLPPAGVLVLELTVNGSNISDSSFLGIPIPVSDITRCIVFLSWLKVILILPCLQ